MAKTTLHDHKNTRTAILSALVKHGSLTRTELTHITGLSRATVSNACVHLISIKIIKEAKTQPSTGGRPAISLQFAENTHAILGIGFQRSEEAMWVFGAFDLSFNLIKVTQFSADITSPTETIKNLQQNIQHFVADLNIPLLPVIGLGLPGLVNSQNGTVISAPELNWHQFDITTPLYEAFGSYISIINNFKAHGLYESRYGEGKNVNDLIYIGINQGIGGSLFQDKKLIHGGIGGAGEIGHMTIFPDGPLCSCGNRGCLEAIAAAPSIEEVYRSICASPKHITATDICIAADKGDPPAVEAIHCAANYLGIAMANLVNVYNPECFILGGFISQNSKEYVETAERVMRHRALSPLSKSVKVQLARRPRYGGALGAAHEALEQNISFDLF